MGYDNPLVSQWITEKYISPYALPKEDINCWLKWKEGFEFDYLVLRTKTEISITRFINTTENEITNQDVGTFVIKRSMLKVKGYFGFKCHYTQIPTTDTKVTFSIDFVAHDNTIMHLELDTSVIVPNLVFIPLSEKNIEISESLQNFILKCKLEKKGTASVNKINTISEISQTGSINIVMTHHHSTKFPLADVIGDYLITITGTGYLVINMSNKYTDNKDNEYISNSIEFVINKTITGESKITLESILLRDLPIPILVPMTIKRA